MIRRPDDADRAWELIDAVCTDGADDECIRQLDARLRGDSLACDLLNDYCELHAALVFRAKDQESFAAFQETFCAPSPSALLSYLGSTLHGTVGYFSSGWPVAYLVATAILGIALLIGSLVPVSEPAQIARQSSVPSQSVVEPKVESVGRITGMVDCRFDQRSKISDPKTQGPRPKTFVSLGDKFALASGLMEITYDTGAKVILQGPVTYGVESAAGGYLSVGKLTARLEKNDNRGLLNAERSASSSSFIVHRSSFAVRTPTAIVTDLGTEFGVEVGKDSSDVCVFAGAVEVAVRSSTGKVANRILLTANGQRSARTRVGDAAATPIAVNPEAFVRVEKFKAIARQRPQHVWIGNASFDDPKLEPKTVAQGGAPGNWTVERYGETDFGVVQRFNDHRQFFFWNEPNGFLRQRYLAHRVEAAGMVYTLRFRVATCNYGKCAVTAHLLLNGEPPKDRSLRLELRHRPVDVNIAEFVDAKFVYVTTPSDVGKRVGIQFDFATLESWVQVFIGDVQLIVVPQADTQGGT